VGVVSRHEFLAELHTLLQPRGYLEIGVQHGYSLRLAGCPAVGVDPNPLISVPVGPNVKIETSTSDAYFAALDGFRLPFPALDLAFIDGMHLYEYALRDFIGVERIAHPGTVVVFDDMLPRNQHEAAREQCPGDWTGDVWRIWEILSHYRPDLHLVLVDTQPTGVLAVHGLNPASTALADEYKDIVRRWPPVNVAVPDAVINRSHAVSVDAALELAMSRNWRTAP
jgi:hypothetical protein